MASGKHKFQWSTCFPLLDPGLSSFRAIPELPVNQKVSKAFLARLGPSLSEWHDDLSCLFVLLTILLIKSWVKLMLMPLSHSPMTLTSHNIYYRIFFLCPLENVVTTWDLSHVLLIYINMSSLTGPMQNLVAWLALYNYSLLLSCWTAVCFGRW